MKIVFATNNRHKIQEISSLINNEMEIVSLEEIGITDDIPEEAETLHENALQKARYVYERTGLDVFADDTGLEVAALGGQPGVKSARYSGPERDFEANITKLLLNLGEAEERSARFRTVIALIYEGREYLFEGIVKGEITRERRGTGGFGYDPVFMPTGYNSTFAEMTLPEKNSISHRALATRKLVNFLLEIKSSQ